MTAQGQEGRRFMTGKAGNVQGSHEPKNRQPEAQRYSCPRAFGSSKPRSPITRIKERLTPAHVEALCRAWLPHGKRQGGWWVATTPWRDDRTPSLGVSFSTATWRDFATGERGDMIDLSMRLFGDSLKETIDGFAEMLGL